MDKEAWKQLLDEIYSCKRCPLHATKKNYVVGKGNPNAKLLLIGEAPGREEDIQGEPFVGRAGQFLDILLQETGLSLNEVYITNILKCRPPENRDPMENEIEACRPHLEKAISLIDPIVIAALGRHSMNFLFNKYRISGGKISMLHGKVFPIDTIRGRKYIVALYHPAVALYNPQMKDLLKKDFSILKELI
ncbi:MAG: uracil-DNA glycosylase [Candidatus Woesearchaeota archaeon]|nr:uracil-DNA glycosylase [Candidatus Woesearchaeota archaeon]